MAIDGGNGGDGADVANTRRGFPRGVRPEGATWRPWVATGGVQPVVRAIPGARGGRGGQMASWAWTNEAANPQERKERERSDYLESEDSMGQVVDFHSLRHGFITYLVTANCPPKVAQMLARHSTISLTVESRSGAVV